MTENLNSKKILIASTFLNNCKELKLTPIESLGLSMDIIKGSIHAIIVGGLIKNGNEREFVNTIIEGINKYCVKLIEEIEQSK